MAMTSCWSTRMIAVGLGVATDIDAGAARQVLDRLFPWWPREADPHSALLWTNARAPLAERPSPGQSWLWHCAPLTEWDGTVPVGRHHWASGGRVSAGQQCAGRRSRQGRADSIWVLNARSVASPAGRLASWTDVGKLAWSRPQGTTAAG